MLLDKPRGRIRAIGDDLHPRFLSEADGIAILRELVRVGHGTGFTRVLIFSAWTGNVRWARNQITTSGETLNHEITVARAVNGALQGTVLNDVETEALVNAVRRAEAGAATRRESLLVGAIADQPLEPGAASPSLFSQSTYDLDADHRAAAARDFMRTVETAGMRSAGYIEVSGKSMAQLDTFGRNRYFQWTEAQYSVTVRDPQGTGSGWAGDCAYDWATIDGTALSNVALAKCMASRNPVRIEPGRYVAILEPQAVCELAAQLLSPSDQFLRQSFIGQKIVDKRITVKSDPMDPEVGFPPWIPENISRPTPWSWEGQVYHAGTWIENGRLRMAPFGRGEAIRNVGKNAGNPVPPAFRMSGGATTIDDMIATTQRGLIVTRFSDVELIEPTSGLLRGYTRDGLWLVENGRITKSVKNLLFTQTWSGALNNVEQLGPPRRVFHPPNPVIVPPLKVRDFNFTALMDAV